MKKIVVVVLAVLVGLAAGQDACLSTSVCPQMVNLSLSVSQYFLSVGSSANTFLGVATFFNQFQPFFLAQTSASAVNLQIGFANQNYYALFDCSRFGLIICTISPVVYVIRNDAIYGPGTSYYQQQVFFLSYPNLLAGNPAGAFPSSMPSTTTTTWYASGNQGGTGWILSQFGSIYLNVYYDGSKIQYSGAVWSSQRDPNESCELCIESTLLPEAVKYVASSSQLQETNVGTGALQRRTISANLLSTTQDIYNQNDARIAQLFYCFLNNNFYEVIDCDHSNFSSCRYRNNRFIFAVVDGLTNGNRTVYNINSQFMVEAKIIDNKGPYTCTQRPWYGTGTGWTQPYVDTSGVLTRSYSVQFKDGGVVSSIPSIKLFSSTCSVSINSAGRIAGFSSLSLVFVVFAYLLW